MVNRPYVKIQSIIIFNINESNYQQIIIIFAIIIIIIYIIITRTTHTKYEFRTALQTSLTISIPKKKFEGLFYSRFDLVRFFLSNDIEVKTAFMSCAEHMSHKLRQPLCRVLNI